MDKHDAVKKPSHYTEGRAFEPKDVIRDWGLNFNLGSAIKYIARAGRKDDIVQDLKKAREFIQFEIDAILEEREELFKMEPKEEESNTISLMELAGMSVNFFIEKYFLANRLNDLEVTAGSKRYYINTAEVDSPVLFVGGVKANVNIELKGIGFDDTIKIYMEDN